MFYKWLRCELIHEGGLPLAIAHLNTTPVSPSKTSSMSGKVNLSKEG